MAKYGWLRWWRTWNKDKVMRLLLWLGLAGILLIGISEISSRRDRDAEETAAITMTGEQVEKALERRITALLRQVEGVGNCQVMVTLESGERAVYAADTVSSAESDGSSSLSEQYLTVDTAEGPAGLLLTHLQPTIKGVAVVCDGGGNAVVQQRVIQVVTAAFHISERRVCVVPQK